eukprot:6107367-Pyramimonas_sp.AAC.1
MLCCGMLCSVVTVVAVLLCRVRIRYVLLYNDVAWYVKMCRGVFDNVMLSCGIASSVMSRSAL